MKMTEKGRSYHYEIGAWGLEVCPNMQKTFLWDAVVTHNGLAQYSLGFWQGLDEIGVRDKLLKIQKLEHLEHKELEKAGIC